MKTETFIYWFEHTITCRWELLLFFGEENGDGLKKSVGFTSYKKHSFSGF